MIGRRELYFCLADVDGDGGGAVKYEFYESYVVGFAFRILNKRDMDSDNPAGPSDKC